MIKIGIIDDSESERMDIQVSILDNVDNPETVSFKEYELERKAKDELIDEIRTDIIEENINCLIVDFKLDTSICVISGAEIVEFMHDETPEFPTVILTNAPDESKESSVTDADKVYAKVIFLDPEETRTAEMVKNLFLNMQKYLDNRHRLEGELNKQIAIYNKDATGNDTVLKILEIENELDRYKQIYQSAYTNRINRIDINELNEAAELLEKYKGMIGE